MATNTRLPSFSSFSTLGGHPSGPPPALPSPQSPASPSYPSYLTESYSFSPSPPSLHQPLPNVADLVPLPAMLQRPSVASGSTGPGSVLAGGQGSTSQTFVIPGAMPELEEGFEFRNFVMDEPGTSAHSGHSTGVAHQQGLALTQPPRSVNGSGYLHPSGLPQPTAFHPGHLHQGQPQQHHPHHHHHPHQRQHDRHPTGPASPALSTSSFASSSSSVYTHYSAGGNAGADSSSHLHLHSRGAQGTRDGAVETAPWGTYANGSNRTFSVDDDDDDDDDELMDDLDEQENEVQVTVAPSHQPPIPIDIENDEPLYVNAKQYERILKRRAQRLRLEELGKVAKARKPYLHESRHKHALRRPRGKGGRFLTAEELAALPPRDPTSPSAESSTPGLTPAPAAPVAALPAAEAPLPPSAHAGKKGGKAMPAPAASAKGKGRQGGTLKKAPDKA